MAAVILAFSLLGTRPKRTAENEIFYITDDEFKKVVETSKLFSASYKVSVKVFIIRRIRTLKHQKSDFSFSSLQLQVVENMKLRNLKYEVLLFSKLVSSFSPSVRSIVLLTWI